VRATIQFDDDLAQEVETSQFETYDLIDADAAIDWGPVSISPGSTLQITCHFVARALESQTDGQLEYQLPKMSKVVHLVVADSLNHSFKLDEPITFPTSRWEDPTPFQPG
jgi:hypothetical protein